MLAEPEHLLVACSDTIGDRLVPRDQVLARTLSLPVLEAHAAGELRDACAAGVDDRAADAALDDDALLELAQEAVAVVEDFEVGGVQIAGRVLCRERHA